MGRSYAHLTLKKLYGGSGNQCSFPSCEEAIIEREHSDTNISEICHIEAYSKGGPRYNPDNKDPEDYDNLILLCRNHHKIIDAKDKNGDWLFSVEQLKGMKREHALSVDARMVSKPPTILNKVIRELAKTSNREMRNDKPEAFEIDKKLEFNEINRNKRLVQKYAVYSAYLDALYDQLENHEYETLLDNLEDEYLLHCGENKSSDIIWEKVESILVNKMHNAGGINYSEELTQAVRMVMVHGFMKCKILEEPKP